MTSKPFEYKILSPVGFYSLPKIDKYYDITSVLDWLKPIQEYKKYKVSKELKEIA